MLRAPVAAPARSAIRGSAAPYFTCERRFCDSCLSVTATDEARTENTDRTDPDGAKASHNPSRQYRYVEPCSVSGWNFATANPHSTMTEREMRTGY